MRAALAAVLAFSLAGCHATERIESLGLPESAEAASSQSPAKPETPPEMPKTPKSRSIDELLLFFPSKFPAGNWQPPGLKFEDAQFKSADGTLLHGWYCPSDRPRAVVLYAHGNAGNVTHRAEIVRFWQREMRATILIFDYRGYGRSEGTPTVEGALQDARAARTFLAGRARVPESQIVLAGESLGGAVAIDLAAREGARALIVERSFSSLKDVATHHYPKLAWLVPDGKLDSVAQIAKFKGPVLFCHGDADRTVPFAQGQKLFAAANEPKQFVRMKGGDHNDPLSVEYLKALEKFIGNLPK